ncbi:phage baseplate protein [Streptomyces erythrochromogenes]|uniref:phage baseplate protein n=1 Tax=Streptomyces erythrochromogenes TaxID=285574 RepID=UPI0036B2A5DB
MNHPSGFPLSRRGLIRAGAGASLAALGLGIGAQSASAATVPATKRFDLAQPSYDLFRSKDTHGARVQQSFAFDWVNKFLFVATKRRGSTEADGDLCINKMDFDGNYLSYMHLDGFGHGVAFAALPDGSGTELWIECAADGGFGTALAPVRYTANTTLASPAASAAYRPISGAAEYTCSVDPVYQRMIVRYHTSAGKRIAVYPLSAFQTRNFGAPLVDFKQPAIPGTAQGYALYGSYMYYLTGDAYPEPGDPVGDGNTYLTSIDINTGTVKQGPVLTKAGSTLHHREPEGLAIYRTDAGESRLFLGFATGKVGDRRSSIFYKNALV